MAASNFPFQDHLLLFVAIGAALIAVFGMVRDRMQARHRDLDRVSLVPWGMVSMVALFVAIVCFSVTLRLGD